MISMEPELKPRAIRVGEVVWDLLPVVVVSGLILPGSNLAFAFGAGALQQILHSLIFLAFAISIGNAVWMQLSGFALIRRITQAEWRESLYLSEIRARPYLISQLKSRAKVQAIPLMIGLLCCIFACGAGFHHFKGLSDSDFNKMLAIPYAGVLYALVALQFGGVCAGFLGHLERIQHLCKPRSGEASLVHISAKWIVVVFIVPAAIIALGLYVGYLMLTSGGFTSEISAFGILSGYLVAMSSAVSLLFYVRLKKAWIKTQEAFYQFE